MRCRRVGGQVTEERWLPIVGWESHYEVSDQGRVRGVPRLVQCRYGKTRKIKSRIRAQSRLNDHYMTPCLPGEDQRMQLAQVKCCHADGDKTNNALSNLRWDTKQANVLDAVRVGKRPHPERTHCRHGHELTPENTYRAKSRPTERGQCRKCMAGACARQRAKRKAS